MWMPPGIGRGTPLQWTRAAACSDLGIATGPAAALPHGKQRLHLLRRKGGERLQECGQLPCVRNRTGIRTAAGGRSDLPRRKRRMFNPCRGYCRFRSSRAPRPSRSLATTVLQVHRRIEINGTP